MTMQLQPISFSIPGAQFDALRRRAGTLNLKPGEYAKRLFDAAYFVRCAAEKGEQPEDAALDRQVRDVFLLADCEPEFIAESLRLPEARVKRILDGWRLEALDLSQPTKATVSGPPAPAPATVAAPPPPPSPGAGAARDKRSERAWPPAVVEKAREMWAEGKNCTEISAAIGKKPGAISMFMGKKRDLFPKRKAG